MSRLDQTLERWYNTKEKIALLEQKRDSYKEEIINYMNHKERDTVGTDRFTVTRRRNTRESVSRKDIPPELWKKVCNRSTFYSYILKKR